MKDTFLAKFRRNSQYYFIWILLCLVVTASSPFFEFLPNQAQKFNELAVTKSDLNIKPSIAQASKITSENETYQDTIVNGKRVYVATTEKERFRDSNDQLKKIDNEIVSSQKNGYSFENKENDFKAFFPKQLTDYLIRVEYQDYWMELKLVGSSNVKAQISNNTVIYKNILANTDFEITVENSTLKENIILNDKPIFDKINYEIKFSKNLQFENIANPILKNNEEIIFSLPNPASQRLDGEGYLYEKFLSTEITKNHYALNFKIFANIDFSSEKIRYPYIIDPTIIISDSMRRSYVVEYETGDLSSNALYEVGSTSKGEARAFYRFDLSGVPTNAIVDSAIFGITNRKEQHTGTVLDIHRITSDWGTLFNWSQQPSFGGSIGKQFSNTPYSYMNYDVTSEAQGWINRSVPNYGLAVTAENLNVRQRFIIQASIYKPYLIVNYHLSGENEPSLVLRGDKDWWYYLNESFPQGSAKINIASGDLSVQTKGLSLNGIGFNSEIGLYFLSANQNDLTHLGYGWDISIKKLKISADRKVVDFIDESGTPFTYRDSRADGLYIDEDNNQADYSSGFYSRSDRKPNGIFMSLRYLTSENQFETEDSEGIRARFNQEGNVISEHDKNGNILDYIYQNGKLSEIKNNSITKCKFFYDSFNRLDSIQDANYLDGSFRSNGLFIKIDYYENINLIKTLSYFQNDILLTRNDFEYNGKKLVTIIDNNTNRTVVSYDGSGRADAFINAKNERNEVRYLAKGHSQIVPAKSFEIGAKPLEYYATDYYFYPSNNYLSGLVYKIITPKVKDEKGIESRPMHEYSYNDDYLVARHQDPKLFKSLNTYSDTTGINSSSFDVDGVIEQKNNINYPVFFNQSPKVVNNFDGNNSQTEFYYDQKNNLIEKSINDGDAKNYFFNASFETRTRKIGIFDHTCDVSIEGVYINLLDIADQFCPSGSGKEARRFFVSSDFHSQRLSQGLGLENSLAGKSNNIFQIISTPLIEPNTTYTLSYYYKNYGSDQIRVKQAVDYDDIRGFQIGNTVFGSEEPYSTIWRKGSFTFTTPINNVNDYNMPFGTLWIYLRIQANASGQTGGVFFDSVRLEKGSQVKDFTTKTTRFEYYENGLVKNEFNPENQRINYVWDDSGNLLSVTDPENNQTTFTYDKVGNRLSKTEPNGEQSTYRYNALGMVLSAENGVGNVASFTYDPALNLKKSQTPNSTFPDGKMTTEYNFDALNRPFETISPYGYTSRVEYDKNGNPIGIINPNNLKNSINYDGADRLTQEINSKNQTTDYKYDVNDQLKSVTTTGQSIALNYDKDGRLISETNTNNESSKTINYSYDRNDNILNASSTDANIDANYTQTNDIISVTANGATTKYSRNKNNQITQIQKGNNDFTKYQYTPNGQVKKIENLRNNIVYSFFIYEYDANGNRTSVQTSAGKTNYFYDKENQLIRIESPEGKNTDYIYSKSGNLARVNYPDGTFTVFAHYGNRLTWRHQKNYDEYFGYDANGNITSRSTGESVALALNFNNNLTNLRDRQAGKIIQSDNNQNTNPTYVQGRFNQALSLNGSEYLEYPSLSNIYPGEFSTYGFWFKLPDPQSPTNKYLFEYYDNAKDNLRIFINPDNKVQFDFTSSGRTFSVISANSIATDDSWQFVGVSWNSITQLLNLNGQNTTNVICQKTAKTCPIHINPIAQNGKTKIHFGASIAGEQKVYSKIIFDQILINKKFSTDQDLNALYNSTSEQSLSNLTSYVYDEDDYLTAVYKSDGSTIKYEYDSQKRLIKKSAPTGDTIFGYDGDILTSEVSNGVTTKYIYDMQGALLYIERSNQKYYPVMDAQGSVLSLRDESGSVVGTYSYDEWGKKISSNGLKLNLQYASYWYDEDTSLYHLGARWYDPTLHRFLTIDPHPGDQDDPLSMNEYVYCANNPITFIDPDGDIPIVLVAMVAWNMYNIYSTAKDAKSFAKKPTLGGGIMVVAGVTPVGKVRTAGKVAQKVSSFKSFNSLKSVMRSRGLLKPGQQAHHIVEQIQISKSGFSASRIHNINNVIALDAKIHAKISGYYASKRFSFTGGKTVRNWLAGKSYNFQYEFGVKVLRSFGVKL